VERLAVIKKKDRVPEFKVGYGPEKSSRIDPGDGEASKSVI